MNKRSQHVAPNRYGGWAVRRTGASRASRIFKTRDDAVTYARHLAERERSELYVHGRDGMIRERDSYESDPVPPKQ
jgi:hypothetical protein